MGEHLSGVWAQQTLIFPTSSPCSVRLHWWSETWREGTWREAPGRAEAGCGPQKGQHAGLARTPPHVVVGSLQRGRGRKWGWGEGSMWGGVGNTQAKSGLTFWFSNPESSLPVARVPDVLSKAPSLGRLWDTGYPSKSAWPPSFWRCTWGVWLPGFRKLHNPGLCPAAPSTTLAQPLLLGPPPPKQLRKHTHGTGHHWVRAPTRPHVCPRNPVLWGRTRLRPHAPDLSKEGHAAQAHGSVSRCVPPSILDPILSDPPNGS